MSYQLFYSLGKSYDKFFEFIYLDYNKSNTISLSEKKYIFIFVDDHIYYYHIYILLNEILLTILKVYKVCY